MKRFLVVFLVVGLVLGVTQVASALVYSEVYQGSQKVSEYGRNSEEINFGFCFWHTDAEDFGSIGTNSSLVKVQDAEDAYEEWLSMSASVTFWDYDYFSYEEPIVTITAWALGGDEQIEIWTDEIDLAGWCGGEYYTWTYDFTPAEVATWESNGWGDIAISAYASWDWNLNDFYVKEVRMDLTTVPEPGTVFMLGLGLVGLAGYSRRKFKK